MNGNPTRLDDRLWARPCGERVYEVGILSDYVRSLGDIMYLETVPEGTALAAGARFAQVESAKAVVELSFPFPVLVEKVNAPLIANHSLKPGSAEDQWLVRVVADGITETPQ